MRRKIVLIAPELIVEWFKWGTPPARVVEGVPASAKLVNTILVGEYATPLVGLILECDEWPDVPDGQPLSGFKPVFTRDFDVD